ncbi:4-galactosyl-N-acetylglucosaminide 3-alpha-L-fucosyltransferase 9 [Lates calcarifer]|uniref:Fucosyltransferase n=1 Tax=Lates calcarifer TaxID=8187 RepID=A0A4W6E7V3_LATCA|nr:4-galactosyl-N-acetylglucosaminide 3-alpha-L-fucosyltransferase 9 [Lates calcarifer]
MSSSGGQKTSLRQFSLCCIMVACCLVLFFIYYKPDIKLPTLGIYKTCPTVICAKTAQDQDSTSNCSSEQHLNTPQSDTKKTQVAAVDAEPDTVLLIWMWPFGFKYDLSCSIFNITRCHLTDNRSLYNKSHGVLFHHRDIQGTGLPKEPRPWFQKWVWSNMESPANSAPIPAVDNVFNLTCNYRLDSSIPVPYGYLVRITSEDEKFKLPKKNKLVCWVVSNWKTQYKRVQYYNELKNHINIQAFGNAFGQHLSDQDYTDIVSSCKFYLSFENSVYKDYITEKLYSPMKLGSVPIVLGPPRQNYEDHIPPDSFIHVSDFSTPKELAERLFYLDQNHTEYMKYFNWKNRYKVQMSWFGKEHACKTCSYLQKNRGYQTIHGLNKWYWG